MPVENLSADRRGRWLEADAVTKIQTTWALAHSSGGHASLPSFLMQVPGAICHATARLLVSACWSPGGRPWAGLCLFRMDSWSQRMARSEGHRQALWSRSSPRHMVMHVGAGVLRVVGIRGPTDLTYCWRSAPVTPGSSGVLHQRCACTALSIVPVHACFVHSGSSCLQLF